MKEELFIFVEGNTDKLYIDNIYKNIINKLFKNYKIIEYSTKTTKSINKYINAVKNKNNWDYIFLADQDGRINKKDKILSKYKNLDSNKVFISVYEIESWIIAGINNTTIRKLRIKYKKSDTSSFTKEQFLNLIPTRMNYLEFIAEILSSYDLTSALSLNGSLNNFNNYINNIKEN